MGMNKYLVTLRIRGQLIKTAVHANSATHARLLCQYQFGMDCVQVAPTQIHSEGQGYPLLDELIAESPPSIKPQAPQAIQTQDHQTLQATHPRADANHAIEGQRGPSERCAAKGAREPETPKRSRTDAARAGWLLIKITLLASKHWPKCVKTA